jgi:hypothetical protein
MEAVHHKMAVFDFWAPTPNNAWLNPFRPSLEQRHPAIRGSDQASEKRKLFSLRIKRVTERRDSKNELQKT